MDYGKTKLGKPQACWNAAKTRIIKYTIEIYHEGLNEYKIVSAPDIEMLQNKVDFQAKKWSEKWAQIEFKRKINEKREASLEEANRRTAEAEKAITEINNLLHHTLTIDDKVNWNNLKRVDQFRERKPENPVRCENENYPPEPAKKAPKFNIFEIIFNLKERKIRECEERFKNDMLEWQRKKEEIDNYNLYQEKEYELAIESWKNEVVKWEEKKSSFLKDQEAYNASVEIMKNKYYSFNSEAVVEYCDMVLNNSSYPDSFPKNYEIEYNPENKIIIVEYQLPSVECLPRLKEVKYLVSKKELKEIYLSDAQILKMFDDAVYNLTLRTIHEIFEADVANALDAVSFNGWIKSINKATGIEENNCILSIQVKKTDFLKIDLSNIDPKICFKSLKGVASSKISSLTPIQPILQLSRVDKRFVESYEVADKLDNTTNIAAMDWEDFEHLVRELFEKEFKSNGGEVKITQASRDGGVDAVAFDPDPIRGGKIVIQAKRYTNTVGVSAVRDLYGTVLNEGATKGILVSTADYGSDAYEFAKGKPLTLLNGSNLLHLLEKHGHHAKIDLREAKRVLAEQKK